MAGTKVNRVGLNIKGFPPVRTAGTLVHDKNKQYDFYTSKG
ncbi:hypothetical protein AOR13_961 [Alteromonas stellipolaris LMG 21856]|nr:hypothetical protein AOR13_961 [Alteromonas stellipolaris LMG 21856]